MSDEGRDNAGADGMKGEFTGISGIELQSAGILWISWGLSPPLAPAIGSFRNGRGRRNTAPRTRFARDFPGSSRIFPIGRKNGGKSREKVFRTDMGAIH